MLDGYIDIYLPDLKYFSPDTAKKYSGAPDYFSFASKAVKEMIRQTGIPVFASDGSLQKGTLIRHMVLPGQKEDSVRILEWMADSLPKGSFLLSLLSQYTPFFRAKDYPEINRRVTSYEYKKVLDKALALGLNEGFMQERSSAKEEYTPPFDLEGL
jgi:putative pyruvate formate lyase activating enzyme